VTGSRCCPDLAGLANAARGTAKAGVVLWTVILAVTAGGCC
jgi:hypothetical protein